VVVAAAAWLVYANRDSWFGGDEWFIITDRGLTSGPGHLGLFEPHYEHWTTIPILAYRALYAVVGLHSYWPYIALALAMHLVVVVLLWNVMVRSRIDAWIATCACAVFAVAGTGFENVLNAWQVTLIAPLALGLGAILIAPTAGDRFTGRDAIAALFMSVAVMCSGVALPMLGSVGLVLLLRRGWRVAGLTVAAPVVLYAVWYATYGFDAPRIADPAPGAVPRFVWRGFTDTFGDVARFDVLGAVVVVAAIAWLGNRIVRHRLDSTFIVPLSLAAGGFVFLAATGYRRANLLGTDPAGSRYAYVTLAFALPLVARAAQWLFVGSRGRRVALALVTALVIVGQVRELDHQVDLARPGKESDRGALLATAQLVRRHRTFLLDRPLSAFEPQVDVGEIAAMDADGKLPSLDDVTRRDVLTALGRLDFAFAPHPLVPDAAVARVVSTRGVRRLTAAPGCLRAKPTIAHNEVVLNFDASGTVGVRGRGVARLALRDPAARVDGESIASILSPDNEQVISAGIPFRRVVITLPDGAPTELCGLVG
jgi:hypothetical protein